MNKFKKIKLLITSLSIAYITIIVLLFIIKLFFNFNIIGTNYYNYIMFIFCVYGGFVGSQFSKIDGEKILKENIIIESYKVLTFNINHIKF